MSRASFRKAVAERHRILYRLVSVYLHVPCAIPQSYCGAARAAGRRVRDVAFAARTSGLKVLDIDAMVVVVYTKDVRVKA
jgi:hypothetical protein